MMYRFVVISTNHHNVCKSDVLLEWLKTILQIWTWFRKDCRVSGLLVSALGGWLITIDSPQTLTLDKVASVYDLPYFLIWVDNCGLVMVCGAVVSYRGWQTVPGEARGIRWKVTRGLGDELELKTTVTGISGELKECARAHERPKDLWTLVKSTFSQRAAACSSTSFFRDQKHLANVKFCIRRQRKHSETS